MSHDAPPASPGILPGEDLSGIQDMPQRQRLLLGMAQTLAKRGYRGATITEVVRFAKVSKRTFYEEFGDKESCFLELYEQTAAGLEQLIVQSTNLGREDWREQIRLGAKAYYSVLAVEPLLTRAYFIEIATLSERATQSRRRVHNHFAELLCELTETARAAHPEVPSRPLSLTMAVALLGGMTEVLIGAMEKDEIAESLDELTDVCTDLIATVVTGQFPPQS